MLFGKERSGSRFTLAMDLWIDHANALQADGDDDGDNQIQTFAPADWLTIANLLRKCDAQDPQHRAYIALLQRARDAFIRNEARLTRRVAIFVE